MQFSVSCVQFALENKPVLSQKYVIVDLCKDLYLFCTHVLRHQELEIMLTNIYVVIEGKYLYHQHATNRRATKCLQIYFSRQLETLNHISGIQQCNITNIFCYISGRNVHIHPLVTHIVTHLYKFTGPSVFVNDKLH